MQKSWQNTEFTGQQLKDMEGYCYDQKQICEAMKMGAQRRRGS